MSAPFHKAHLSRPQTGARLDENRRPQCGNDSFAAPKQMSHAIGSDVLVKSRILDGGADEDTAVTPWHEVAGATPHNRGDRRLCAPELQ